MTAGLRGLGRAANLAEPAEAEVRNSTERDESPILKLYTSTNQMLGRCHKLKQP